MVVDELDELAEALKRVGRTRSSRTGVYGVFGNAVRLGGKKPFVCVDPEILDEVSLPDVQPARLVALYTEVDWL